MGLHQQGCRGDGDGKVVWGVLMAMEKVDVEYQPHRRCMLRKRGVKSWNEFKLSSVDFSHSATINDITCVGA